jgi:hypothetical protein
MADTALPPSGTAAWWGGDVSEGPGQGTAKCERTYICPPKVRLDGWTILGGRVRERASMDRDTPGRPNTARDPQSSGFGAWIKRHWLLGAALTALVTATVGLLVNRFGPGIIDIGKPPLRFTVTHEDPGDGSFFAFRRVIPRSALPPANGCGAHMRGWLARYDAVDGGQSGVKVTVEGLNRSPVLIESMRARIVSRTPPISGSVLRCVVEGVLPAVEIGFNLDEPSPIARTMTEDGSLGTPYFEGAGLTVAEGEHVILAVTAFAEECFCRWVIEMTALVDGNMETFTIDDGGRPFETSAIVTVPARRIYLYGPDLGYCSGELSCFPDNDGVPGPPPQPLSAKELKQLRQEQTVQVIPPFE